LRGRQHPTHVDLQVRNGQRSRGEKGGSGRGKRRHCTIRRIRRKKRPMRENSVRGGTGNYRGEDRGRRTRREGKKNGLGSNREKTPEIYE